MKKMFCSLAGLVVLTVICLPVTGLCADEYSYRFLWPAEINVPGINLTELAIVDEGQGEENTPAWTNENKYIFIKGPNR